MMDMYSSLFGIPVAGATLPIIAFLFLGIYGSNVFLLVSVIIYLHGESSSPNGYVIYGTILGSLYAHKYPEKVDAYIGLHRLYPWKKPICIVAGMHIQRHKLFRH